MSGFKRREVENIATLFTGDAIEVMQTLGDCSFEACVTDPPYGLSKEPDISEVLKQWMSGERYAHAGSGFMGKEWDSFVPGPEYWREVFRVLKPGGYLLCFAGTRTWDLMSVAIRFAGFENRDTIYHAYASMYGSGFPKSLSVSAAIDREAGAKREVVGSFKTKDIRRNVKKDQALGIKHREGKWAAGAPTTYMEYPVMAPTTEDAKRYEGYGTALKPAWEPVLCFRKPLSESSVAKNVLRWGTGALNVDACRVGRAADDVPGWHTTGADGSSGFQNSDTFKVRAMSPEEIQARCGNKGRYPSNTLLSHSASCVRVGEKRVKGCPETVIQGGKDGGGFDVGSSDGTRHTEFQGYGDADGYEVVDEYACAEDCPVALIDRQSGESGGGRFSLNSTSKRIAISTTSHNSRNPNRTDSVCNYGDEGTASRYFQTFESDLPEPMLYVPKPSRQERDAGLEGIEPSTFNRVNPGGLENDPRWQPTQVRNIHPTVKGLALMRYLVRLVTPPGGTVLDCFAGSGSTGCAAVLEGFNFIGIDQDATYCEIAEQRMRYWETQKGVPMKKAIANSRKKKSPYAGSLFDEDEDE